MTSKDREFGGDSTEPRQPWVRLHACVVAHTASRVPRDLVKAGHAFYVFTADNLFAGGSPFCSK